MVKASPEKKKENTLKKGSLTKEMKKKSSKGKQSPEDIVEFHGRKITVAEMEKMDSIIQNIKRWANASDIQKFVEEFPAFITEGTLKLYKTSTWNCVLCKKVGHPREVCPKSWKDGKWIKLCYVCGEPGFPHPKCKKRNVCFLCTKEDHHANECPDRELYKRPDDRPKKKEQGKRPLEEKNEKTPLSPKKKKGNKSKA